MSDKMYELQPGRMALLRAANDFRNECNQRDLGFECVMHDANDVYAWVDFADEIHGYGFTMTLLTAPEGETIYTVAQIHGYMVDTPLSVSFVYDASDDSVMVSGDGMGECFEVYGCTLADALEKLLREGF